MHPIPKAAPTPNDISGEGRDEYGRPLGPLGPPAPAEAGIIPEFLTRPPPPRQPCPAHRKYRFGRKMPSRHTVKRSRS